MEDSGGLGEDSGSCLVWEEQQGVPRAEEGEIWVQEQEEGGWKWDRVRQSRMLAEAGAGVEVGVEDRPPSSPAQPRPGPRSPAACTAACTRRRSLRSLRNRSRTAARRARRGRGIVSVST